MLGKIFDAFVAFLIRVVCKVDAAEFEELPQEGPYIIIFNHINFLEAPLFYLKLRPRRVFAIMKVELSRAFLIGRIAKRWGGLPLERGAPPSAAFRKAGTLLGEGAIIALAPEGTRSRDGNLQRGNPGVVTLALQNDALIYPVGHFGSQNLGRNLKRLRRTPITMKLGAPFRLKAPEKLNKESRAELTEQMMLRIAELLPEELRGVYRDTPDKSGDYLIFD